jgi:hypothetical protein
MFTKEQLLQAIPDVPAEFSLEDLKAILNWPPLHNPTNSAPFSERPVKLTPEEAADWNRYTSPETMALYAKFSISPEIAALRGIAANLSPADLKKSAKEWEAERMWEKCGV